MKLKFNELNKEQKKRLKEEFYRENNIYMNYETVSKIDELVSDEEIEKEYGDWDFTKEYFKPYIMCARCENWTCNLEEGLCSSCIEDLSEIYEDIEEYGQEQVAKKYRCRKRFLF